MESEGIKAVKEGLLLAEKAAAAATKISKTTNSTINDNMVLPSRDMMMEDDDLEESC